MWVVMGLDERACALCSALNQVGLCDQVYGL